jgi:hypothetical protein
MVLKVPIYVDIDLKGIPQEIHAPIADFLRESFTESLKRKLNVESIDLGKEDGMAEETKVFFSVVSAEEALQRFK